MGSLLLCISSSEGLGSCRPSLLRWSHLAHPRRRWPRPLVIVSVCGHVPHRHLHANYRQMYTHPFVRADYTVNLRPWNEQGRFFRFCFVLFFNPSDIPHP